MAMQIFKNHEKYIEYSISKQTHYQRQTRKIWSFQEMYDIVVWVLGSKCKLMGS